MRRRVPALGAIHFTCSAVLGGTRRHSRILGGSGETDGTAVLFSSTVALIASVQPHSHECQSAERRGWKGQVRINSICHDSQRQ